MGGNKTKGKKKKHRRGHAKSENKGLYTEEVSSKHQSMLDEMAARDVQYIRFPAKTNRGKEMLVDSEGYQYTQKVDKRRVNVNWRCCVRNKSITCKASVLERNGQFIRGLHDHICESNPVLDFEEVHSQEEQQTPIEAEFVAATDVQYTRVPATTVRGKERLVDSEGYRYTQKVDKRRVNVNWRCCVRNKTITCKASVLERNGQFIRGLHDHICEAKHGLKEFTENHEDEPMSEEKPQKKETYSVGQILDKAEECMDTFDFEMAKKYCQRALEMDPDNIRVLEMTGNLFVEIGDVEGAKKCFGRAVTICPDSGFAKYMYLGQVFEGQQAIDCFCKGIDIILTERPERNAQQGEGACALTSDEGASDDDIASAFCSIAEIFLTDSCFEDKAETECLENLELALQYNPNSSEAYQLMASYFLSTQSNEKAKEMINKSISLWLPKLKEIEGSKPVGSEFDPVETCPLSYLSRVAAVKILIEVEQFDVAEEILQMLLEEDDEVVQVWYLLGWLHVLQDTEENKSYARHFLYKAKKISQKIEGDDLSMMQHIDELLEKLGPGDEEADDWLEKQIWEAVENEEDDNNSSDDDDEEEDMEH